jgi:hypothetical protein
VGLGGLTALLALPTLGPLSTTLRLAKNLQGSNPAAAADPGNLLRPLRFVQTLGIWLGESHRVDPKNLSQTYVLIGVVAVCVALGLIWLIRRRAWALLTFVIVSVAVWALLTSRGTEWTNAKVLMLLSPVVMLIALVGAFRAFGKGRVEGVLLAGLVVAGVLGSDALAYHATGLAPTQRYKELRSIGQRFGGQGPTLMTDFDEYALYFLRNSQLNSPGYAFRGPMTLANGGAPQYGHSYDIDELSQQTVQEYRLIVMRRSPSWSRPPANFVQVWNGPSYEVWRRVGAPPTRHVGFGEWQQAVAMPPCRRIGELARSAVRDHGNLTVAERPPNILMRLGVASHSPNVVPVGDLEGMLQLVFAGPGKIEVGFRIPAAGRYRLWLGGDIDRPLHLIVDRQFVAAPTDMFGGDASKYLVATVTLKAGAHDLQIVRGGGGLGPGDNASSVIDGVIFEPVAAEQESMRTVEPPAWRSLCGRPLDWLEVG